MVNVTWQDLGISGAYEIRNAWTGANSGTSDKSVSASLDAGES